MLCFFCLKWKIVESYPIIETQRREDEKYESKTKRFYGHLPYE